MYVLGKINTLVPFHQHLTRFELPSKDIVNTGMVSGSLLLGCPSLEYEN